MDMGGWRVTKCCRVKWFWWLESNPFWGLDEFSGLPDEFSGLPIKNMSGEEERLCHFIFPSVFIHTKEGLTSPKALTDPASALRTLLPRWYSSVLLGSFSTYHLSGGHKACATRSMDNGELPPGMLKTSPDWVPVAASLVWPRRFFQHVFNCWRHSPAPPPWASKL